MAKRILDPWNDFDTKGYLRNIYGEKDLTIIGHLESAVYVEKISEALVFLRNVKEIQSETFRRVHRILFGSLYPWAGEDRSITAPNLSISRGGYQNMFANPDQIERALGYALSKCEDKVYHRTHPGEIFGLLAHAHPFLEGNGRTILTIYMELCRRSGFMIKWNEIDKSLFLQKLTEELKKPEKGIMDEVLAAHLILGSPAKNAIGNILKGLFGKSGE